MHYEIVLPDAAVLLAVQERLQQANISATAGEGTLDFSDQSGNGIRLRVDVGQSAVM